MINARAQSGYVMPIGKYQSRNLQQVPAYYLLWLINNSTVDPQVSQYVANNRIFLEDEAKKKK